MGIQIQISITYDCNLSCKYCIQFVDMMGWKQSTNITINDLDLAAKCLSENNVSVSVIRISGGEPTVHPLFIDCVKQVKTLWKESKIIVCTNSVIKTSKIKGVSFRKSPVSNYKFRWHQPAMYSPFDLGFSFSNKTPVRCPLFHNCGSLFDKFGFAPCVKAGTLGRILRIDPYSSVPITTGNMNRDMCKHCFCILSTSERYKIKHAIYDGKIKHPTKTFVEGLILDKENPFVFKTFEQRTHNNRS